MTNQITQLNSSSLIRKFQGESMEIVELTQDLKAKDELIEDLIHDAHDSISISNDSEVKKYNDFLDGIEETCRQMRIRE